jgi:uncharacterized membrane protein YdfJ with MMPL/SSD domain
MPASEHALALLRERIVPESVGRLPGIEAKVGGLTAESKDFNDLLKSRAPFVFAFVLGLAFLLLTASFHFGLSMDYHVFILTRVREAVDRPGD